MISPEMCRFCVNIKKTAGSLEELVQHALVALRESLPNDMELTDKVRPHPLWSCDHHVITFQSCDHLIIMTSHDPF